MKLNSFSKKEKMGFVIMGGIRVLFYLCLMPFTISGDSNEYINVSTREILKGNLDIRRVPVYSLLLDTFQAANFIPFRRFE